MKSRTRARQTRWLWNGPCGAKPSPASQNYVCTL